MMARFPRRWRAGARSCRWWSTPSSRRCAEAMPDRVPAGHHGLLGGAVVFFGVASQDQAPLRGAEHRGRRLGRPAVRGRRVRHGLGLPGRRAQRLDRGHRAEMPGAGARAARCGPDSGGAGKYPRRPRHRHARAQPGRGPLEFRAAAAQQVPAVGPVGRQAGRAGRLSAAAAGRERVQARWAARTSRCRSAPRPSCAPAAAAAGAIRSSAIRRWCATTCVEELISREAAARALRRGATGRFDA